MLPIADQETIVSLGAVWHSDVSHATARELSERAVVVSAIPAQGITGEGILVIPSPHQGPLYELVSIVDRLLGPGGCPWDQAQTHETLKRYLLEEAYEVLDAIDAGSDEKFRE